MSIIAAEVLDQLEYELVAANLMYRDVTSDFSTVNGFKVGESVKVRTVPAYRTDEFAGTINPQEVNQSNTQITIEKHFDCSIVVGSREKTMNLDGVQREIVNPVAQSIGQQLDVYLLSKIVEAQGIYPSSNLGANAADLALMNRSANLQQISKSNRIALVDENLEATLLSQDIFHKFDTRGQPAVTALQEASMGRLMGFNWYSSVNLPTVTHVAGTGAAVTNNAIGTLNKQGTSTLQTNATVGTFNVGDKIAVTGAYRQYTVAVQTLAGAVAIPLVEQISELIPNGAAVTTVGNGLAQTYQGIVFNPGAFSYACPMIEPAPVGGQSATVTSNGFSLRVTEAYDIMTKKMYWSFDMLCAAKMTDMRLGMLLADTP